MAHLNGSRGLRRRGTLRMTPPVLFGSENCSKSTNSAISSQNVPSNQWYTLMLCSGNCWGFNVRFLVGSQNNFTFFIFLHFALERVAFKRVVSFAPGPYARTGDIQMFYWTSFLYHQSDYWKISYFQCPIQHISKNIFQAYSAL